MEIIVRTERYTAQSLQKILTTRGTILCTVLGTGTSYVYSVLVDNAIQAILVKGILDHCGIEIIEEKA